MPKSSLTDVTLWKRGPSTGKAVLFSETDEEDAEDIWLPRSEIEVDPPDLHEGKVEVTLPVWLAKEKGLI